MISNDGPQQQPLNILMPLISFMVGGSHGRPCHQNNFLIMRGSPK